MELLIIGLTLLVVFLLWDRSRYPRKYCRPCKGTGRRRSWLSGRAFGVCRRCGGKGELRR
ncbi:hypothetical protein [Nonomuraea angiospora]|uniref:hypothetical protein n=1 Tax=Nonomuraea angiospora TaxID=46172 RepID=UPI0029B9ED71|nr:hypothetical protein [Nonomuraea angiospora]MDX3099687.1 hypothetical protein [Nonomuraea angiospora]